MVALIWLPSGKSIDSIEFVCSVISFWTTFVFASVVVCFCCSSRLAFLFLLNLSLRRQIVRLEKQCAPYKYILQLTRLYFNQNHACLTKWLKNKLRIAKKKYALA